MLPLKSQCKKEEQDIKKAMERIVHDCSIKRNSEYIKTINRYLINYQKIISKEGICDQKLEFPEVVQFSYQINDGFINREWEIPENQRLKEENQRLKEENQRLREENCNLSSKDIDLSTKRLQGIATLALKITEFENELSDFEEDKNEHQNNKNQYFISNIQAGLNLYEQNYPRHARFFLHRVTSSLSEDYRNPSMIGILLELASAYYRIEDWMEGEKLWKILDDNQAVTQPENIQKWIDVLFAKGNYLFACKKWKPAVDVFQKAIDLFDKSPDSTSAYLKWQILYKLGKAFHYQGIWIKAGEYYSRTLGVLSKIKQSLESNFPNELHPSVENIEKVEKILNVTLKLDEVAEQIKILLEDHAKIENLSSMASF